MAAGRGLKKQLFSYNRGCPKDAPVAGSPPRLGRECIRIEIERGNVLHIEKEPCC